MCGWTQLVQEALMHFRHTISSDWFSCMQMKFTSSKWEEKKISHGCDFYFAVQPQCRVWSSLASYLFVCIFHGGVFRVPCMNFISCQSPVTSYQKSVKCQSLSHHIVLFISDALPLSTSIGDGCAHGLIWIIRRRRMRYLCSRCMEISGCDIAVDGIRRQLFAPPYSVYTHTSII